MHIHLDAVGGIAGDMFVAAMLDAFPHLIDDVLRDVRAVLPPGSVPALSSAKCNEIAARNFSVMVPASAPAGATRYAAMLRRIADAPLAPPIRERSAAILGRLAEAESNVHGVPIVDVHFHELADWDSLADVVAAAAIVTALGEAAWSVSPLPLGRGRVQTAHGLLPVPAPATARLLQGFVLVDDGIEGERVTPTGAAILSQLVRGGEQVLPGGTLKGSGVGAGTRRFPGLPNILRVLAFETASNVIRDRVDVLSFDIDDMTGEEIGVACGRLRETPGVLDLSVGTRRGKKDRPLEEFRLLVEPHAVRSVADQCFRQTSTIGLRIGTQQRLVLHRTMTATGKRVERPGAATVKADSDGLVGDTLAERRRLRSQLEQDG